MRVFNQTLRLIWIDWLLSEQGWIQRKHLTTTFDMSVAQAAIDFVAYATLHKAAIAYSVRDRRYQGLGGLYPSEARAAISAAVNIINKEITK